MCVVSIHFVSFVLGDIFQAFTGTTGPHVRNCFGVLFRVQWPSFYAIIPVSLFLERDKLAFVLVVRVERRFQEVTVDRNHGKSGYVHFF